MTQRTPCSSMKLRSNTTRTISPFQTPDKRVFARVVAIPPLHHPAAARIFLHADQRRDHAQRSPPPSARRHAAQFEPAPEMGLARGSCRGVAVQCSICSSA
jgi:hypothetical protein